MCWGAAKCFRIGKLFVGDLGGMEEQYQEINNITQLVYDTC
jgi:hypothetical protein